MRLVTPKQVNIVDQYIESLGLPVSHLMEHAGRSVFEVVQRYIQEGKGPKGVLFLCGIGNNGGDALVAARLLAEVPEVTIYVALLGNPEEGSPLFQQQWKVVNTLDDITIRIVTDAMIQSSGNLIPSHVLRNVSVVVDGVFGTGFHGFLSEPIASIFDQCKEWRSHSDTRTCIAIDIPSGVNGLTGYADVSAFRADETITLLAPKVGMLFYPGRERIGKMSIGSIGFPFPHKELWESEHKWPVIYWNNAESLHVEPRSPIAHKGTNGHVYIVGGSPGIYGAPILSAEGALRSGAGKVTIVSRTDELDALRSLSRPEMMIRDSNDVERLDGNSTVVIGPGGGRSNRDKNHLLQWIQSITDSHMVIDADGLMAIASDLSVLKRCSAALGKEERAIVLTPHFGEFSALTGIHIRDLYDDPIGYAKAFAEEYHVYVVLKGQPTILATPFDAVYVTTTGNPYMGTGGMGDVLAGVIGAMLSQSLDPMKTMNAINVALYAHSRAGDLALDDLGPGFTPTEVAQRIGRVLRSIDGYKQDLAL